MTKRQELEAELSEVKLLRDVARERITLATADWESIEMEVMTILRQLRDLGGKDE